MGGEIYEIDVVKNQAGYNDWVSAKKSDGSVVTAPVSAATTHAAPASARTMGGSTYSTAEERAKTQLYIVRQSNINAAVNVLTVGAKTPPKLEEVLALAKRFESHVFGDSDSPIPDIKVGVPASFDDLDNLDDLPS